MWSSQRFLLVIWVLISLVGPAAHATDVEALRLWRAPDHTRVVFDLSGPVQHKIMELTRPDRLVIDLDRSRYQLEELPDFSGSPITRLRHGVHNDEDLRLVFDLSARVKPRSFVLQANGEYGDRLVLDLYDRDADKTPTVKKTATRVDGRRDVVVAIDAGHGGEDPGAIGPNQLREKHVVLSIARELEALLKRQKGYRPVMIRTGDYYVGLKDRRDKARAAQADLFVSIHADAFKDPRARGASVYALSERGATSATARFLATQENSADQIGGVDLSDKDDLVRSVLADLSMTASLDASLRVGHSVLGDIRPVARLHSHRVEQAAFAVLKSPDIPSILVETGFISNPTEAKNLGSRAYRQKMARAIYGGIHEYFTQSPPPNTYLAWLKHNRRSPREYVVARGDTLSEIASRFRISLNDLRSTNDLAGNTIRVGQKLLIPAS